MNFGKLASAATALVLSTSVNAALIDNGIYTTDSRTGLNWLDLTESTNRSVNYVLSQLGNGGQFEGWAYATEGQVNGLFDSAGGTGPYIDWSVANDGIVSPLLDLWGATDSTMEEYRTVFITELDATTSSFQQGVARDTYIENGYGLLKTVVGSIDTDTEFLGAGHALVRVNAVPVPAAVWLFGSGLIGLIGFTRRKKA